MTRAFLAALALAAATTGPAHADPPDDARFRGFCGWHAQDDGVTHPAGTRAGYLYAVGAAYSMTYEHDPVTITRLACELVVAGTPVGATEGGGGPVVVVPPHHVVYTAPATANPLVCMTVELVDAHGQQRSFRQCPPVNAYPVPPHELDEAQRYYADPLVCALLRGLHPSAAPEVVTVDADGDLAVAGRDVWTCPPYET